MVTGIYTTYNLKFSWLSIIKTGVIPLVEIRKEKLKIYLLQTKKEASLYKLPFISTRQR